MRKLPEIQPNLSGEPIDSAWALYLLNDANYAILKSWKKYRGPLFDRRVIDPVKLRQAQAWAAFLPEAVVAIPQDPARSLKLGGSPAAILAREVGRSLGIPAIDLLTKRSRLFEKRQAELDVLNRLLNPMRFEVKPAFHVPRSVILVDDFITTGHTVREAARALKLGGVRRVGVLSLGARGTRVQKEADLLKRA